jgi:hypothetical protein
VASSVDGTGLGMLLSVVIQSKRGRCEKISGRTKSRVDLHLEKEHNRTRYEELVDIFDHVILYMTKCGFRSLRYYPPPKAYFGYQLSNLARPRNQRVFDLRQVLRFSRGGRWLGVGMPTFLVDSTPRKPRKIWVDLVLHKIS